MRFFWGHIIEPLIKTNSTIMLRKFPRLCMILFVNMWDCSSISNLRMWWEGECRLFVRLFLWPEPLPSSLPACPTPHTFWIISEKATRGKLTLFKVFTERQPCIHSSYLPKLRPLPATIDWEVDTMKKSAHTDGNRAAAVIFSVKYRQEVIIEGTNKY